MRSRNDRKGSSIKKSPIFDYEEIKGTSQSKLVDPNSSNTSLTRTLRGLDMSERRAMTIKRKFDEKHNPSWHCVVGRTFGSYVTYEHLYVCTAIALLLNVGFAHPATRSLVCSPRVGCTSNWD